MSILATIANPAGKPTESKLGIRTRHTASLVDPVLAEMHGIAAELTAGSYVLDPVRMNDQFDIYRTLKSIHEQLDMGQYYIGRVDHITGYEHSEDRDTHLSFSNWKKYSRFIVHRVLPKLRLTARPYQYLTGGRNRRISRTEALGRLKHAGFEIVKTRITRKQLIFLVQKRSGALTQTQPHYGPLVRLSRLVKNGRKTTIYKFRTMYPYAEYIQDYVYEQNALANGGKIKNDFRITSEGRFMRKFFIDELPMLINLLKGDIKLVGVRPLSSHYFSLYTSNMQEKRIKHKPGLLPPYYSEKSKPQTLEEIMVSEIRYLFMYERRPLITEFRYFYRIVSNILINRIWSS
jgi:hypothetical protein